MSKLSIINKGKCKPEVCNRECKKYCPIEKKELDSCITILEKASIDEKTCVGCGICQKRCPLSAIEIINLPSIKEENLIHRYGSNGFALYGIPTPKQQSVIGFLGRNGIGKSTAVKILANQIKPNLGKDATQEDLLNFFKGTELQTYFRDLDNKTIAYKPQNLSLLSKDVKVIDLLKQLGDEKKINELSYKLSVNQILNNKMNELSGGELQRVAIIAASLKDADIYFFDEPLAYLDIEQRLKVSDYIRNLCKNKIVFVVEHDLLILDYLTDYINIFFGAQGAFGVTSTIKVSRNGVNSYLDGYLKDDNMRIRDKSLTFNFTKNSPLSGQILTSWPEFNTKFESGFKLNVSAGEIHKNHSIGILGKNGIGKTTFVKCLNGLQDVEIDGKIRKLDLKLKISYKPQYIEQDSEEVVRDIVFKEKIDKRLSTMFNIGVLQSKKINELSGGELQRLSIARCLAKDADVYLLDEPSAYLDVEERISAAKAIKEIMMEKEKTAFVVDHDLLVISYVADSIINFDGESGMFGQSSKIENFEEGISNLLKSLDITLRKEKETGRPRINKKGSVLDREQKESGKWVIL